LEALRVGYLKAAIQTFVRLNEYESSPIAKKEKAMKKLLVLLVVLAVAGLSITAAAQEAKQTVILFQSMEDPNFPPNPEPPRVFRRLGYLSPTTMAGAS
jgi:hypothetical protein